MRIRKYLTSDDRFLCDILKATGYRVDDVLQSSNIQWQERYFVLLKEAKTGKVRTVLKTPELRALIILYKRAIGDEKMEPFDHFCPPRRNRDAIGSHYNRSTLYRHFQEACKKANLSDRGYTIHSLRKCYAIDLYRRTESVLAVQNALNHDRITTTLIYLMDAIGIKK